MKELGASASVAVRLQDPRPPYAYWIPTRGMGPLTRTAVDAGFGIWTLDTAKMVDEKTTFQIFGDVFRFADSFGGDWGRNWPAVRDGLHELGQTSFRGCVVILDQADVLWKANPTLFYKVEQVLKDVSEYWHTWKDRNISFKTVFVAEQPDLRRVVGASLVNE